MAANPDSESQTSAASYAASLTELEEILGHLRNDEADIDQLGAHVRRAAELIAVCRDRLSAARLQVNEIIADLQSPDDTADE